MRMPEMLRRGSWFQSHITTWVLLGFLAVGGFFVFTEHTAHLLGILPFAIFLLCPLMMLFMHHGDHDGHGGHDVQGEHAHTGQNEPQSMVVEPHGDEQPKEGERQ